MGFFDMLNSWKTALAALVLVLTINLGLYFFLYLPHLNAPSTAPLLKQTDGTTLTTRPENSTPKTTPESTTATP